MTMWLFGEAPSKERLWPSVFGFEESLLIMALANKHIHTFESKAEKTGTLTVATKNSSSNVASINVV
jgi:hypothetical protein